MADTVNPETGEITRTDDQGNVIDQGFETPGPTSALAPVPTSATSVNEAAQSYKTTGALQTEGDQATSSDYAGYVNPADQISDIGVAQGEQFMTPETTVAGQLEKLLNKDSALSQQARRQAREGASALGMVSSSSAIGDVYARQVSALTPVATKDAETAKQFKQQEQATQNEISKIQTEAEVSGSLTQQKAAINEQTTRINQEWQAIMKGMDTEAAAALEDQRQQWATSIKQLEGDITRELRQQEIDAQVEQTIITSAHDAMNNYQITIQNLLANESFLDNFAGNAEGMKNYFNDLFVTVESSIRYQAKAAGVYNTLESYIDELAAANLWTDVAAGTVEEPVV